ncbi:PTS transporter subunit EIIC [Streptomyces microflavus]|uniref:PTS transporter subunit EIIC n=1 Tax=Streptomyces microflavus TaxID=1919 RepID=UPI00381B0AAF
MGRLRRMGQGLALPIAALPAAGLLLRLGQPDMLGRFPALHQPAAVLTAAGGALFDYLPVLFAIGIAAGLSRTENAAPRILASVIAYLLLARVVIVLNPPAQENIGDPPARWPYGALLGILGALLALAIWKAADRWRRTPPAFAIHGLVAVAATALGVLLGLAWPAVNHALTTGATAVADHSVIGGAIFGTLNRLLLPLGIHHLPSSVVWFMAGDDCGGGVRGDVNCFFTARAPESGIFLGGFFPIAMFALPAAALAMWRSAPAGAGRRRAAALLLPAAAMSSAFGITEPIELAFAYTVPLLYGVHAVLTGLSLAVTNALDIHAGFLFSAGSLDYALNYPLSTRGWMLLPLGAVYAVIYYFLFRYAIRRFDLRTPGREPQPRAEPQRPPRPEEGAP